MKRSDIWWAAAYGLLAVFTVLFCVTGGFAKVNIAYPYLAGFAQFAVYATAGELLSGRLLEGTWQINRATWFKSLSWGIGGVLVTLAFTVFSQGTRQAMAAGLLAFLYSIYCLSVAASSILSPIKPTPLIIIRGKKNLSSLIHFI